jgi:hypothetical protein
MNPPTSPFRVRARPGECQAKRLAQVRAKSGLLFRRRRLRNQVWPALARAIVRGSAVDRPGSCRGEPFLSSHFSPGPSRHPGDTALFLRLSGWAMRHWSLSPHASLSPAPASPYFRSTLKDGCFCFELEQYWTKVRLRVKESG